MPSCHNIQTNNLNLNLNLKEELQLLKDNNNNNSNNYNHNKNIRKRGSSSSSSSSLVRRYRFKRAILVGKKGGSSTPVIPMWKTNHKTTTSPPSMDQHSTKPLQDKEVSVSARKLAATLWEINDLPPSRAEKDFEVEQMRSCKETMIRGREKNVSLSRSGFLHPLVSADPSHSPASERMKGFEGDGHKRRVSALSHQHHHSGDYYLKGLDAHSSASLIEEVESQQRNKKNRLKEARSGLSTSKKLLKVLNQVCLREQQSSSLPLILTLGSKLDRVCHQIDQLIQEQHSSQNDIEHVMNHFAEEKAACKRREREKIHNAIKNVAEELEVEKKLRRQTERLNKKIAKEMAIAKASHLKASKELEREKRAKEIMEQICDELARGIGEDRAQVQELKRESAKVREEVEREREMLQLADVLREERVQMKLSEAKYQFEEKNAFLEKLRNELESYMRTKEENGEVSPDFKRIKDLETYIRIKEENGDASPDSERIKDLETYFNEINGRVQNIEKDNDLDLGDGVEHDEGDELDDGSDLHSIELNMDDGNRGYRWSYACENVAQNEPKRVSVDKESLGRKSLSEIIQWGSICFNKGTTSGGNKRDFGINFWGSSDHFDPERSIEFLSQACIQDGDNDDDDDNKDDSESYSSIMGPQDCISFANPVQSLTLQHTGAEEAGDNAFNLEGENLK